MVYYDPSFEQRRQQILGGKVNPSGVTGNVNNYTNPSFEARRTQILANPTKPQPIISTPQLQPQPNIFQSVFSTLGQVAKQAGNLIDTVFGKSYVSPISESQIIKPQKQPLIEKVKPITEKAKPIVEQVKKTVSSINEKLGPLLFSLGPVPSEYQEPSTLVPTIKKGVKPTAGKFIGGMIEDALMAYLPVQGVSLRGGRNILKEGLNVMKGIKTATVFAGFRGLLGALKEEKVTLPDLLVAGGLGQLVGMFEPQVMAGFPKTDIIEAKNVLKNYGFKPSEFTNIEALKTKFRSVVMNLHPDKGGNPKEFKTFVDAYNKVTSAGIDNKWSLPDITSWITDLWEKRGQTSEALYQQANSTFRSFIEKIIGRSGKTLELTPQASRDIVIGSNLEKTELGKILIKSSLEAQNQGKNITITQVPDTVKGGTITKTPQGINIGVRIIEPTENANKPPVSPTPPPVEVTKPLEVKPIQPKVGEGGEIIPATKGVGAKEIEITGMVKEAIFSGDMEAAQAIYNDSKIDNPNLPTFDEIVNETETYQKKALEEVRTELKGETLGMNPDDPVNRILAIADKLGKHFKGPGALYKIVGMKRKYTTPAGTLTVGGDAKIAFDNLIFSTNIVGFSKNIKILAQKFNKIFNEINVSIEKGDIDGADYEQFKNRFSEILATRTTFSARRGTIIPTGAPKGKAEVTKGGVKPTVIPTLPKKVSEYGFNPKNLEEPQSPKASKETDKIIKRSEIAKELSDKLGVPIRRGKFNRGRALGIFKVEPKVVRIKRGGLQTVFHEVGHFLDDKFNLSESISIKERKALLEEYAYKFEGQAEKQRKEAFAEFLRFRMTGQTSKAANFAPNFFNTFDDLMNQMPEVKEVIDTATRDFTRWNKQPATAKILSHISIGTQNKMSLGDKINSSLHDLYTATIDDLHPLSEFSKLAKKQLGVIPSEKDPYVLARNLRGWTGKAELFLNKGTFAKKFWTVDEKGKSHMNFKGKSYSEIMKPVEKVGKLDDFRVYIVAKRAIELANRGIRTGIAKNDAIEALKELGEKNPEFEKVANERLEYKNQLLEYAADESSGLLGPEGLKKIKQLNKFHVPFYRVMEETIGAKFMGRRKMAGNLGSPIKKIKGSEREIIDPLESDIKDTYAIINAVERNSIGVAMANLAGENFELGRLFEKVDRPMKGIKVNAKEVLDKITHELGDDFIVPEDLADIAVTIFRPTQDRGPNMLNLNMGDKQMVFQVDPELFKALQGLNTEDAGVIMRILSMPSKLLRAGATLTPDFSLRNPLRDQFSAFIYSKYGYVPGIDLIRGIFEVFRKGEVYDLWKAGGGEHAMLVSMDREYLQQNLKELFKGKVKGVLSYITHPLKLLQVISELGEEATRLGEMRKALSKRATPIAGSFASREVTLDFARIGAKTKAINLLIAFWNANVQGMDKLVRSFKSDPFRTLFKVLMGITLPSILLYMSNRDDKRWKEIPAWQKDLFWIVFTKNHIIRIPKPFEVGILFGSVPERVLEYLDNKDPAIFNQLKNDIANGATPGFIPTSLLPILENISNYSFFLDRPIVSQTKEGLPPEAQAGPYTSEISKLIGKTLNYSPAKVDNLIQGYSGGIGRYTAQIIDKVLIGTKVVNPPPKPAPNLEDLAIIKAFMIREPVGTSSESVNKVYNMYSQIGGQVTYVRKLVKEGNTDEAKQYIKEHPEIINIGTINGAVSAFSDLSKARDIIMNSKTLTSEQKQIRIRKLDEAETTIAQRVLKQLKK
jgi:hypothetical protein